MIAHVRRAMAVTAVAALTACSSTSDPESTALGLGGGRVTMAGVNQPFPGPVFETVNLVDLLDPRGMRDHRVSDSCRPSRVHPNSNVLPSATCIEEERHELASAFYAFRTAYHELSAEARRNMVQDRLMAASEQQCNLFKTYLRRQQAEQGFWFGALTTTLGGVGALIQSSAANILSGAAGITSGVNAEFNQHYFSNLASHVIVEGIEARRARALEKIEGTRQKKPSISEYLVEAAIQDALVFHASCQIVSGLLEAADSIRETRNPGLLAATQTVLRAQTLKNALDRNITQSDLDKLESSSRSALVNVRSVAGRGAASRDSAESPGARIVRANGKLMEGHARFVATIDDLARQQRAATSVTSATPAATAVDAQKTAVRDLVTAGSAGIAALQACYAERNAAAVATAEAALAVQSAKPDNEIEIAKARANLEKAVGAAVGNAINAELVAMTVERQLANVLRAVTDAIAKAAAVADMTASTTAARTAVAAVACGS